MQVSLATRSRKKLTSVAGAQGLHEIPYIFMRWKERFFVHSKDEGCSLTIAGFLLRLHLPNFRGDRGVLL